MWNRISVPHGSRSKKKVMQKCSAKRISHDTIHHMTDNKHISDMDTPSKHGNGMLTLRFVGKDENGSPLHDLRAIAVAQVLQGITELEADFANAGVFHDNGTVGDTEIFVKPAKEGSFIIEIIHLIKDNGELIAISGFPTLGQIIYWCTKSIRATPSDFTPLDNGNVKVRWSDGTVDEIPRSAWAKLNESNKQRKNHLRKIMAGLADSRVDELHVYDGPIGSPDGAVNKITLTGQDYEIITGQDSYMTTGLDYGIIPCQLEADTNPKFFTSKATLDTISFSGKKWKILTSGHSRPRTVIIEDEDFLSKVFNGKEVSRGDVFTFRIREDKTTKNGRTKTTWTAVEVKEGSVHTADGSVSED